MPKVFCVGDRVVARRQGRKDYYACIIQAVDTETDTYTVRFDDRSVEAGMWNSLIMTAADAEASHIACTTTDDGGQCSVCFGHLRMRDSSTLIRCESCKEWVHLWCYGRIPLPAKGAPWICQRCSTESSLVGTDADPIANAAAHESWDCILCCKRGTDHGVFVEVPDVVSSACGSQWAHVFCVNMINGLWVDWKTAVSTASLVPHAPSLDQRTNVQGWQHKLVKVAAKRACEICGIRGGTTFSCPIVRFGQTQYKDGAEDPIFDSILKIAQDGAALIAEEFGKPVTPTVVVMQIAVEAYEQLCDTKCTHAAHATCAREAGCVISMKIEPHMYNPGALVGKKLSYMMCHGHSRKFNSLAYQLMGWRASSAVTNMILRASVPPVPRNSTDASTTVPTSLEAFLDQSAPSIDAPQHSPQPSRSTPRSPVGVRSDESAALAVRAEDARKAPGKRQRVIEHATTARGRDGSRGVFVGDDDAVVVVDKAKPAAAAQSPDVARADHRWMLPNGRHAGETVGVPSDVLRLLVYPPEGDVKATVDLASDKQLQVRLAEIDILLMDLVHADGCEADESKARGRAHPTLTSAFGSDGSRAQSHFATMATEAGLRLRVRQRHRRTGDVARGIAISAAAAYPEASALAWIKKRMLAALPSEWGASDNSVADDRSHPVVVPPGARMLTRMAASVLDALLVASPAALAALVAVARTTDDGAAAADDDATVVAGLVADATAAALLPGDGGGDVCAALLAGELLPGTLVELVIAELTS